VHDARLGCSPDVRRIASTRARPRVSAAGRTANAHATRADVLLFADRDYEYNTYDDNECIYDYGCGYGDAAPAAPDSRAGVPGLARTLALGAAKRVEFLVAATAEKPGLDAVSSDRKGNGAMVEALRRRGQVRNPNTRRWIVARIVIPFFHFSQSLQNTHLSAGWFVRFVSFIPGA